MNSPRVHSGGKPAAPCVGIGRAHGKAILLGEHTVVHGTPAIAFPLPALPVRAVAYSSEAGCSTVAPPALSGRFALSDNGSRFLAGKGLPAATPVSGPRVAVEEALRRWDLPGEVVEVVLRREIPQARGLGSSAADAAAAVRAVAGLHGRTVDPDSLYELVQCGEQFAHGRASGVDARAASSDRPIWFHAGTARPLDVGLDAALVIADTGILGATQQAVAEVRGRLDRDRESAGRLLERATELVESAHAALAAGRAEPLGRALLYFQELLDELGVGSPRIDTLVTAALEAGAFGAKLTGAGLGGCVLALTEAGRGASTVSSALRRAGAVQTWTVPTRSVLP
ncbi:mevalonate kinase [Nocardia pneumoniae]|uniref:mevalonate kinase n=1 Tax=Nocardia pneumoniae TaxID=228601 RepID=UPI000A05468D|nr:mevalonate kinase [Nocardia pneumoniae]